MADKEQELEELVLPAQKGNDDAAPTSGMSTCAGYQPAPSSLAINAQGVSDSPFTIIVIQQPRSQVAFARQQQDITPDYYWTLSVVLSCIAFCFIPPISWLALICSVPAIMTASNAKNAHERGDVHFARRYASRSLGYSIAALVTLILEYVLLIILLVEVI